MLNVILLASAIIGLISVIARAVESIYQLRQKPELSTVGKIWQVLKNFFTMETYKGGVT